jgi:hypothetical protein
MADGNDASQRVSEPDPALKRLDRLVGAWSMKGCPVGSNEVTITGKATFKWLHREGGKGGGFFLQQDMDMGYAGKAIRSHEVIYYNPETKAFSSHVYSNMASDPWPYEWDIQGDVWTISIAYGNGGTTSTTPAPRRSIPRRR